MKSFFYALRLTLVMLIVCVGLYSLAVLGMAQAAPNHGKGRMITDANGKAYYENIGQRFDQDRYFYSRPSAVSYHADGSGGSNKGPNNPDYLKEVQERVAAFRQQNPGAPIPMDMVTASGSGLDPDISPAAAQAQVPRIARVRNLPENAVAQLVEKNTTNPILGPQKINVLHLNIALDQLK